MWLVDAFRGEKQDRFFALLARQADALTTAATSLATYAAERRIGDANADARAAADSSAAFDDMLAALQDTFVTPMDRQDIYNLSVMLGEAADYFAGAATEIELFDVAPGAEMRDIIGQLRVGAADARDAIIKLRDDPSAAIDSARKAMRCEDVIEDKYRRALAALFSRDDVQAMFREREIYRHLSNSADRIDDIGRLVAKIAVKVS